jgi:5-methylcytosine-specific restriction endonuclease McrA
MDLSEIVESKSVAVFMSEWDAVNPRPDYINCEHKRFMICIAYDSLGRPRYKKRCAICYGGMSHVYKRVEALEILAGEQPFDDEECQVKRQEIADSKSDYYLTIYETQRQKRRQAWRDYYDTYLKSIKWALLRVKALTIVGYKCVACKSTDTLQLHHKHYQTLGEESLDDVVILCKKCHELLHLAQNALRSEMYQLRDM